VTDALSALLRSLRSTTEKAGLMWAATDVSEKRMTFATAKKACEDYRGAGFSDWRLPTIDELETLRDRTRHDPAADPELGLKSNWYWSSTPLASSPSACAWFVGFYYGSSYWYYQSGEFFVRAVRSAGQQLALGAL
jgi:hypothetical protein